MSIPKFFPDKSKTTIVPVSSTPISASTFISAKTSVKNFFAFAITSALSKFFSETFSASAEIFSSVSATLSSATSEIFSATSLTSSTGAEISSSTFETFSAVCGVSFNVTLIVAGFAPKPKKPFEGDSKTSTSTSSALTLSSARAACNASSTVLPVFSIIVAI